jgi:tRNA(Ile)-lysidine synthase
MRTTNFESASMSGDILAAENRGLKIASVRNSGAPFESELASAWNPGEWCDVNTVLAVSGGADSVSLLRAMTALKSRHGGKGKLVVAHLNHQLREESREDVDWLEELALRLGLPLEIGAVDVATEAIQRGDGLEASGREARYKFLVRTAEKFGARFVVTAHTANDQAETVLHRIVRGTGLAGLAGVPTRRQLSESVTLVRPMLSLSRFDVLDYLAALSQDFRTDASNEDISYTRNRVRHNLLPELREYFNPEVDSALTRLATQAREIQQALEFMVAGLADECLLTVSQTFVQIACKPLVEQPEALIREVCRSLWREVGWPMQAMGYCEWRLLSQLVTGQLQHANLPGNVVARRTMDQLLLERNA